MARRVPAWPVLMFAAVLLPAGVARAQQNAQTATGHWHTADQCGKDAFKKFPDFTPDSNAKREAFRLECLRNHRLPAPAAGSSP